MRLRQLISLSALAIMAYQSYGKLRKAKSGAARARGAGMPAGGTGAAGQVRPASGPGPVDRPAVDTPVILTDEIR